MRGTLIRMVIVLLFCFPFGYFSMYQDFANWSMIIGYLIMIVVTSFLAFFGKKFRMSIIIVNILSAIISLYFTSEMAGNERWNGYFKPLTPYQLLILVSFLNLIPQFFAIKLANRHKNKSKD